MGHLYRVSWLAQALQENRPELAISIRCLDSPEAQRFWSTSGIDTVFEDWSVITTHKRTEATIAIVDWLDSPEGFVDRLAKQGISTVLLDDSGPAHLHADVVINALVSDLQPQKRTAGQTLLLSGADWVQFPLEAVKLRGIGQSLTKAVQSQLAGPPPELGPVRNVMVSFGGAVKPILLELALSALKQADYSGHVTVMPAPGKAAIPQGMEVDLHQASSEFHALLAASDLVVCSAGLTLFEAAFLGVPAVCLPVLSVSPGHENHQFATANRLESAGCCRIARDRAGSSPTELAVLLAEILEDPEQRGRMSAAGMRLFDGRGLQRTTDAILSLLR